LVVAERQAEAALKLRNSYPRNTDVGERMR